MAVHELIYGETVISYNYPNLRVESVNQCFFVSR